MSAPALLVAAPASGSGKTLLTLGLLRALKVRGLEVASFKTGPDYIDPAFHSHASGRPCRNLDGWAMRLETLAALLAETGEAADIVIGEGVMGLFDGAPDGTGSTADLASLLGLPVVLVADTRGLSQSIAPLLEGFIRASDHVEIVGVVLNATASERHERLMRNACDDRFSTPVIGCLPRTAELALPSRHLGLVQAGEHAHLEAFIARAAELVERHLDLDRLLRLARRPNLETIGPAGARPWPALGQRIAVARDTAFAFAYPAVLDGWRRQGAAVIPFSPLADEPPDGEADAIYLPGGYPELHAATLARNRRFILGLQAAAWRGARIYGECGGYMVLGRSLTDRSGQSHPMAELLPVTTSFAEPRLHLGYRELRLAEAGPLGSKDLRWRGHEFHYAAETGRDGPPLFFGRDTEGNELGPIGCRQSNVMGAFVHLIDRFPHLALIR